MATRSKARTVKWIIPPPGAKREIAYEFPQKYTREDLDFSVDLSEFLNDDADAISAMAIAISPPDIAFSSWTFDGAIQTIQVPPSENCGKYRVDYTISTRDGRKHTLGVNLWVVPDDVRVTQGNRAYRMTADGSFRIAGQFVPPDINARVTSDGSYRVTTTGDYRIYT